MKLLFVVQRYGADVFGGAEHLARSYATELAARGHTVEVLTTRARSYVDWANHYPAGDERLDGVLVHRLPVARPRDNALFGPFAGRVYARPDEVRYHLQREWMRLHGPEVPGLEGWLAEHSGGFDAVLFVTYLYYTTWAGVAASRAPAALFPAAHDEAPLRLPLFDGVFAALDGFAFLTEEEAALVLRRFRVFQPWAVLGIGIERPRVLTPDVERFRRQAGVGERPYLIYAGRIDAYKGALELFRYFQAYKRRRPGSLALVYVGEEVASLPAHPDVFKTGFVPEATREAAMSGAQLLVQPSHFESFSLVLAEAWAQGVPAVVQARSEVLAGQARRARGAISYHGYAEFEAALDLLLPDAELRRRLGENGRAYVRDRYDWDRVLARFEGLLERILRPGRELPAGRMGDKAS